MGSWTTPVEVEPGGLILTRAEYDRARRSFYAASGMSRDDAALPKLVPPGSFLVKDGDADDPQYDHAANPSDWVPAALVREEYPGYCETTVWTGGPPSDYSFFRAFIANGPGPGFTPDPSGTMLEGRYYTRWLSPFGEPVTAMDAPMRWSFDPHLESPRNERVLLDPGLDELRCAARSGGYWQSRRPERWPGTVHLPGAPGYPDKVAVAAMPAGLEPAQSGALPQHVSDEWWYDTPYGQERVVEWKPPLVQGVYGAWWPAREVELGQEYWVLTSWPHSYLGSVDLAAASGSQTGVSTVLQMRDFEGEPLRDVPVVQVRAKKIYLPGIAQVRSETLPYLTPIGLSAIFAYHGRDDILGMSTDAWIIGGVVLAVVVVAGVAMLMASDTVAVAEAAEGVGFGGAGGSLAPAGGGIVAPTELLATGVESGLPDILPGLMSSSVAPAIVGGAASGGATTAITAAAVISTVTSVISAVGQGATTAGKVAAVVEQIQGDPHTSTHFKDVASATEGQIEAGSSSLPWGMTPGSLALAGLGFVAALGTVVMATRKRKR